MGHRVDHKHSWTKAAPELSEPAPILRGAYIWYFEEPLKALPQLQKSLDAGEIESFSPLVVKKQDPRLAAGVGDLGGALVLAAAGDRP